MRQLHAFESTAVSESRIPDLLKAIAKRHLPEVRTISESEVSHTAASADTVVDGLHKCRAAIEQARTHIISGRNQNTLYRLISTRISNSGATAPIILISRMLAFETEPLVKTRKIDMLKRITDRTAHIDTVERSRNVKRADLRSAVEARISCTLADHTIAGLAVGPCIQSLRPVIRTVAYIIKHAVETPEISIGGINIDSSDISAAVDLDFLEILMKVNRFGIEIRGTGSHGKLMSEQYDRLLEIYFVSAPGRPHIFHSGLARLIIDTIVTCQIGPAVYRTDIFRTRIVEGFISLKSIRKHIVDSAVENRTFFSIYVRALGRCRPEENQFVGSVKRREFKFSDILTHNDR